MTTPKFNIVQVYATLNAKPGFPQQTRLLCVETGHVFVTVTSPVTGGGWSSGYLWCWPRVNGLAQTWLLGDNIGGKDGKAWTRNDPNTAVDGMGIPYAHADAVAHITALAAAGYVDWSKATYSGRPIPNLFSDAVVMPQSYAKVTPPNTVVQRKASYDPRGDAAQQQAPDTFSTAMDEVTRLAKEMGIDTLFPTAEDIHAISKIKAPL
jgi:hypothetical protein